MIRGNVLRPAPVAVALILFGLYGDVLRWPAVILSACFLLFLITRGKRLARAAAAMALWLFLSRRDKVDWVLLRRTSAVVITVAILAGQPRYLHSAAGAAGLGVLSAWALAEYLPHRLGNIPGMHLMMAVRFRMRYQRMARELGWDKGRRGNQDRAPVPRLRGARHDGGGWTLRFLTRGDWNRDDWDSACDVLTRYLGGHSHRLSVDGSRVAVRVFTRPMPQPGDIQVREPRRITRDGILIGHDGGGSEVRWAADDRSAHGLIAGPIGSGKSYCIALMLLQAAATDGWVGEVLDGKETHDWDWMTAYGVTVTRRLPDIHARIRELEAERQRIESTGRPTVRRLIVIDEVIPVMGDDPGPDRDQRRETAGVVSLLVNLSRSAWYRILLAVQRPDVRLMGSGVVRDNMPLRAAFGAMKPRGLQMVFPDGGYSDMEREAMDGTAGRALITGTRKGVTDAFLIQVPELLVHRPNIRLDGDAPPTGGTGERDGGDLDARVLAIVTQGPVARAMVARALGLDPKNGSLRAAVDRLTAAGLITTTTDPRGRVILHPVPVAA